jgi:hypothetical protein
MRSSRKRKRSKPSKFVQRVGLIIKYLVWGLLIGIAFKNLMTPPDNIGDVPMLDQLSDEIGITSNTKEVTNLRQSNNNDWYCSWFPNDHKKCDDLFRMRLPLPKTNILSSDTNGDGETSPLDNQRWLFLGDSTMKRLFDRSALKAVLVLEPLIKSQDGCLGQVSCEEHLADRCKLNENLGLPYAEQWLPPDPSMFEGPKKFGASNPFCTDCSGCQTQILECRTQNDVDAIAKTNTRSLSKCSKRRYGGFITMEFARDTEIQTPEFRTTQENVAAYVDRVWNTPDMLHAWGKPICVLGTGNHDILLDGITTVDFIKNVRFMLTSMMPSCEHMIWLGNTTNGRKSEFLQTMKQMKVWDRAVKELLESEPELRNVMSFLDVLDASLTFPHADFIHMGDTWYEQLGLWFTSLM